MGAVLIEAHLADVNGIPADDTINSWVFVEADITVDPVATATAMTTLLKTFYNDAHGGTTTPVGRYLAGNISRVTTSPHQFVCYALAPLGSVVPRTPLGGPIYTINWTLEPTPGSATDLPRECAAVMSYAGNHAGIAEVAPGGEPGPRGDTHPAARHRGRIYLGPLNQAASGAGVNGPGISAPLREAVAAAALSILTETTHLTGSTLGWGVWSRKNALIYPIQSGWIDDAFDTQRRRGIGASTRTVF